MNIWHDIASERVNPQDFYAIIEIPKGCKVKYELDKETGMLLMDRVLYTSTHYPANYGFIPKTYADDHDPLDVLLLCSETLVPLSMVRCFPIGVIMMEDGGEKDEKIIALPYGDPTYNSYKDISELPEHIMKEMSHFFSVYKALEGKPMTVRYLDPPLHEFVPHVDMKEEIDELAKNLGITSEEVIHKINALHESNPMMGHRGCRLAVTYPEIAEMQTRAVLQAAIDVTRECGYNIVPEIMIPLVGSKKELAFVKSIVDETAKKVFEEQGMTLEYHVGTMIEIPRAAVTADEIAEEAEFFSFGTNDLTQMTFGFSRDDAGKFLGAYYDNKIFESDPFARLDTDGVGKLVQMAAKLGRQTRPNLKLGICGEHGGDPSSVMFCHKVGLNYVSCSPFRVPIARLAAAHAAILEKMGK